MSRGRPGRGQIILAILWNGMGELPWLLASLLTLVASAQVLWAGRVVPGEWPRASRSARARAHAAKGPVMASFTSPGIP